MSGVWYGCVALGVFCLIGGFVAYSFEYTLWGYPPAILIVLGFVLIIAGVIPLSVKKPQEEGRVVYVPLKKCPKCGKSYAHMQNCPTCGAKLE